MRRNIEAFSEKFKQYAPGSPVSKSIVDMKQVICTILAFLAFNGIKGQDLKTVRQNIQGLWTECIGVDSITVFQCSKGFKSFNITGTGSFTEEDSMICNYRSKEVTGRWEISGGLLTIYHDTNECLTNYPLQKHRITWMNNDLFYSISVGTVDWAAETVFTVFKRIK